MGDEFEAACFELARDASVRAVVLTGAGDRAFSAGGDIDFLRARRLCTEEENRVEMLAFYRRYLSVRQLPVPVIAAVQGAAVGAGLCLAAACDLRVVCADAKLAFNFTRLAIHPGMGASYSLPRLVGPETAADLLLTGRRFSGLDAVRMGLCAESVSGDGEACVNRALELADGIAGGPVSPLAVRQTLATLRGGPDQDRALQQALEREAAQQAISYASDDFGHWINEIEKGNKKNISF